MRPQRSNLFLIKAVIKVHGVVVIHGAIVMVFSIVLVVNDGRLMEKAQVFGT
jgi:hypothetical protein